MVAGAAALVKSVYPDLTGYQAGELLRVTANDTIYEVNSSITFKNKLGKGLLDIKKALTDHPPDIRLIQYKLQNAEGKTPKLGEDAFLVATFQNFLWPSSGGLQVKLTSKSALFNVSGSTSDLGIIGTNQVITNASNPFKVKIQDNIPENLSVDLLFEFFDGAYYDYQFTSILLNPTFLNVEENQISSTIAENGRIGYQDTAQAEGLGTVFDGKNLLFEMGLMLGTSNTKISDAVRSIDNTYDHDFVSQERIKETSPGDLSQSEISGTFNDDSAISSKSNVLVRFRTMVWKGDPNNHYFIIQYNIKNNNLSPLNNFYAGLYADWDISNKGQSDRADWDSLYRIGYIYSLDTSRLYYAGIQILSGPPDYYAIDNDSANAGPNSFGVYDGFTDKEKFESLSSGIGRKQAGFALDSGADVSHTVASGPYVINPGDSITVAFAIHATKTLQDLLASVAAADTMYNYTLMATPPVCPNDTLCWNDQSTLIASGASKFNWYTDKSGGNPAYTGDSLSLNQVDHDTLVYVSTADHSWESVRVPVQVTVKANPTISVSGSTTLCNLDTVTLMVQPADSYLWNPGNETTQSIYVTDSGNFSVEVKDNALGCDSHSPVVKVIKNPSPVAGFTSDIQQFMINQPTHVTFSDQSVNPSSWFWLLSDGQTSTLQNPDFTINSASDIGVTLTVTSSNGCQGKDTQVLTVTGLDPFPSGLAKVYPNPSNGQLNISADNPATSIKKIELMNTSGKIVLERFIPGNSEPGLSMISTDGLQPGIYILRILMNNQRVVTYKIIIN